MAVTKIWTIKDSLQRVLDYAANPDKTEYDALAQTLHYAENDAKTKLNESAQLVTGIHCRADHAWEDMRAVQERFGKTDGVVALHAYQSFREGEVTPEQCHEIGVALARKVWGKRFQVLVATHMNKPLDSLVVQEEIALMKFCCNAAIAVSSFVFVVDGRDLRFDSFILI